VEVAMAYFEILSGHILEDLTTIIKCLSQNIIAVK
jgi:hypothetical protein